MGQKGGFMKKGLLVLLAIVVFAMVSSEVLACYHPPVMLTYRKGTTCYGFVSEVFMERKNGIIRYFRMEVLQELPCPKK